MIKGRGTEWQCLLPLGCNLSLCMSEYSRLYRPAFSFAHLKKGTACQFLQWIFIIPSTPLDPRLAFQRLSDNEELFLQPCLGGCLHSSRISVPVVHWSQSPLPALCKDVLSLRRKTRYRALQFCTDGAVGLQVPQEIISSRTAFLRRVLV